MSDPHFSEPDFREYVVFAFCASDHDLFRNDPSFASEVRFTIALHFWQSFPVYFWLGECEIDIANQQHLVRQHGHAQEVMMRYAESVGVDSRPIHESGQVCVDYFLGGFGPANNARWPICVSSETRRTLPDSMLRAIITGESAIAQLIVRMNLDETDNEDFRPTTPLQKVAWSIVKAEFDGAMNRPRRDSIITSFNASQPKANKVDNRDSITAEVARIRKKLGLFPSKKPSNDC